MTEDIILKLCKPLLSSFLCTVQVSAFKGSIQQEEKKKKEERGHKKSQGMEPYKKKLARLEPFSWKGI